MSSEKQDEANRNNSKKSTGPKTDEGKTTISQNAIKHGILSKRVPIDEEEKKKFIEFATRLNEEFKPIDQMQEFLVDRIVSCAWRLQRLIHIEALLLKKSTEQVWIQSKAGYEEAFSGAGIQSMAVLSKYEKSIESSLYRALILLRDLQQVTSVEVCVEKIS